MVFTSGFAETDADGAARQRRMGEIARASGMRILGPNCLGVYNAAIGFFATFTTTLDIYRPRPGPVAIVSQSGAYGSHLGLLARRRRIDVGLWVTTGNECDVTVSECIAWMAARSEIDVVAAYAEGVREGDALLASLDAARVGGKSVFFTKTGRSKVGAEAARSHTAALAGAGCGLRRGYWSSMASCAPTPPRRCSMRPTPRASEPFPRAAALDS